MAKRKNEKQKGLIWKYFKKPLTKKEKLENRVVLTGFLFGWVVSELIFLLFLLLMIVEPFYQQDLDNIFIDTSFKLVANSWQDEQVVQSLSYLCSLKESDEEKVNCVYGFIVDNIVIGYHDDGTNRLNQPEEIFVNGSVCRDSSVLFMSVMNNLEIENELIHEPGHVYNRIYLNNWTCDIDIVNDVNVCSKKNEK